MISGLSPSDEQFSADLARIQAQIERASRQLSSGRKVSTASDAPDQVSEILQLHADLSRNTQIQTNLSRVKAESDVADTALQQAVQILEKAQLAGTEAANSTTSAGSRKAIAVQVQGLFEQLVNLSRTTVVDRYIFSGDQDTTPAYAADGTRLLTAVATRQVEGPNGARFAVARTAQDIFDARNADDTPASDNAFVAVSNLVTALNQNDASGIDAALNSLAQAHASVSTQLEFYGEVQNRVNDAIDAAAKANVQLSSRLSAVQDADAAAAIMELNQANVHQQAALQAHARIPTKTLFDYLA